MIKLLGTKARKEMEEFLQQKVFLELFVKVQKNWRDDERHLKNFGYIN
jgi:GTP-binding protein Era